MKSFRTVLFWMHLACGAAAGVVILIMCVTGVALTYEKQMLEWADRRAWTAPSPAGARPLSPETLLAKVVEAQPGAAPIGVTLRADRRGARHGDARRQQDRCSSIPTPARSSASRRRALRSFFRTMTTWHRYLALEGASRATGKAITGAANLVFLFIVLSGMYLWLPARLDVDPVQERAVVPRRTRAEGARLQLAQRHRHLVGDSARDRRRRRDADFVSVGQQPRLPHGRRHAAGPSRCSGATG